VKVEIDLDADALSVEWAPRASGSSEIVRRPDRRGVRIYYDNDGNVVGFEALGWSGRTSDPTAVDVVVHPRGSGRVLAPDTPLAQALAGSALVTDIDNRPVRGGKPMLTLGEAATLIGKERSWLSREMSSGHLRGMKIGRAWWTSKAWVDEYVRARSRRKIKTAAP
jgi:hypothetical protein